MRGELHVMPEKYQKLSPFTYAQSGYAHLDLARVEDERCPKCQSEELYRRLKKVSDVPVELVLYPGGNHHFFETASHPIA
jgi:dipeptidyl aminopeptidase/acylaminoacyl peptidase